MNVRLPRLPLVTRAQRGFTLIELLVVTGITGLLLLTVSSMFMTVLVGRAQSSLRDQVHTEGNEIMGRIEFIVRNSVEADCSGATPVFTTITSDEVTFTRNASEQLIMDTNGTDQDILDSESMRVMNFTLSCQTAPDTNKKSVSVYLQLRHSDVETEVSEEFTSIVQLRNS